MNMRTIIHTPQSQSQSQSPHTTDIFHENNHQLRCAIKDLLQTTSQKECNTTIQGEYDIPHGVENIRDLLYESYDAFKYHMRKLRKKELSEQILIYLYRQLHSFTKTLVDINTNRFNMVLAETSIESDHMIRSYLLESCVDA